MFVWNAQAHHIVQTYLQAFEEWKHITPFLVLEWPDKVGKRTMITQLLQQQLGRYRNTDVKVLRNLSEVLWKTHAFKVAVSRSDQQVVDKKTGIVYEDLWSRDLRGWLARAPLWVLKVVIIEDIDRMTTSAANALLKEFEEPLAWRLIIGTVNSWKVLLDTIVSRAFLVRFHTVSDNDMQLLIPHATQENKIQSLLRISRGAPWRLVRFLEHPEQLSILQTLYSQIKEYCTHGWSIVDQMMRIKKRNEQWWSSDMMLEMLIGESEIDSSVCIEARKMMTSNVHTENILWDCMLRMRRALR